MRRPLLLAIVLLLLVSLAGPARADDEAVARLENRVEMLLDLVAELRKEVVDLRHRVTELEVTLAQGTVKSAPASVTVTVEPEGAIAVEPPEVKEPAQPAEPKTTVSQDGEKWIPAPDDFAIGHYSIDREASVAAILERTLQAASGPEEEAAIREMAVETFAQIEMKLHLKADGTFTASVSGMGNEARTAGGAWSRKGDQITLLTTQEDGVEKEQPDEVIQGTWKDGRFTLSEDGDEFVVVFVKQKPQK